MNSKELFKYSINIPTYVAIYKLTKRCGRHKKGTLVYNDIKDNLHFRVCENNKLTNKEVQCRQHGELEKWHIEFVAYDLIEVPKQFLLEEKKTIKTKKKT